ncbi:hypothetical protein CC2G_000726 [Coprinopsis cinerea AmutBmut pab1-1]|nr:hypothetical protein CC2G_000726 [Coprinopsis cinerea AmutBmut pab1-1]
MDDDEVNEVRNPFPSPPSHYTRYSSHNLKLLALLKERAPDHQDHPVNQHQLLSDQKDVPEWDLGLLEKPRVDWILDEPDAHYNVFGERWPVKEKHPSLAEAGITQLYSSDPSVDRRPALVSVLKSLLVTYSNLISSLLDPPPLEGAPEWNRHMAWLKTLSLNLLAAANDLRPMQARCSLELMMQRQLELRREETRNIHDKCDALEAKLKELRATPLQSSQDITKASVSGPSEIKGKKLTKQDVVAWVEQV